MAKDIVTDLTGNEAQEASSLDEAVTLMLVTLDLEYSWVWGEGRGMVPEMPYHYDMTNQEYMKLHSFVKKNKGIVRHWFEDGELNEKGHAIIIERPPTKPAAAGGQAK